MYYKSCVLNFKNSSRNAKILHYNRQLKEPDAPSKSPESFSQNNLGLLLSAMFTAVFPERLWAHIKVLPVPSCLEHGQFKWKTKHHDYCYANQSL